ncbi:winged helix-turn-helix domain-containing protein [Marinifaba aquimaris]|uniref:winged helix-turn-helix domain-containing protein n=1 Tax=Marinifaba aquimaris TaxID=2741323 RepID=UPI0031B5F8A4
MRPKTFSLLQHFILQPKTLISKQTLLDEVWDDVIVDEQVLFQTIRELRQAFNNPKIIKNIPRKGYIWQASVELITEINTELKTELNSAVDDESATKTTPNSAMNHSANEVSNSQTNEKAGLTNKQKLNKYSLIPSALLSIGLMCSISYQVLLKPEENFPPAFKQTQKQSGSLIILPFDNQLANPAYSWLRLGAMDQINQQITSTTSLSVMNTEYVLDMINTADSKAPSKLVNRLFELTGALVVVETQVSGDPGDFQISYNFHYPDHIKQGVLFAQSIDQGLSQLANTIAQTTGTKKTSYDNFNNQLMAKAWQHIHQRQWRQAQELLTAKVAIADSQYSSQAHFLLALSYYRQNQFEQSTRVIKQALGKIDTEDKNLKKLHFLNALNQVAQNKLEFALVQLQHIQSAQTITDRLYLAYSFELLGQIQLAKHNVEQAFSAFNQALFYHQQINCPTGQFFTYLQLANIGYQMQQEEFAEQNLHKAKHLITQKKVAFPLQTIAERDFKKAFKIIDFRKF